MRYVPNRIDNLFVIVNSSALRENIQTQVLMKTASCVLE